jgi:hypothetical protein
MRERERERERECPSLLVSSFNEGKIGELLLLLLLSKILYSLTYFTST